MAPRRPWWVRWPAMMAYAVVLAGVFVLLVGNWVVMPLATHRTTELVPDLFDRDVAEAKRHLLGLGLVFVSDSTDYVWDEDIAANRVASQDPPPYDTVKSGRRVRITVSRGPRLQPVPRLLALSPVQAKLRLEQEGFAVGAISYEVRSTTDQSDPFVTGQNPLPGELHPYGDSVSVVVDLPSEMPDLRSRSLESARRIIEMMGLEIGSMKYEKNDALLPRSVVSQSIPPGARIRPGNQVDLVLSHL